MSRRVVITGMGAITPIGNSVPDYWESLRAGKHGIGPITKFDTSEMKVKLAAEVKGFDPERYLPRKEVKRMDPFCQYAIGAADEAIRMSGLSDADLRDNDRVGIIVGSGIGGLPMMEDAILKMGEKGPNRVSPLFIPTVISNMVSGNLSIHYGIKGLCSSIVTACATGNNCIGDAYRHIKHGYSDVILAGGSEASISMIGIAGFAALTALSPAEDPDRASIPFDEDRSGFVMGEGSGILVVEALERAQERGATIYAEIVGYGSTSDAYHITSPDPEGKGAARAMLDAVKEASINKSDVTYINAHGTSTPANDLPETKAIKLAFGDLAYQIPISSTKSMTGHLLGAAGATESIATIEALRHNFIPPTAGLEKPGEGCDLNYVPKTGIAHPMRYALTNSFGFGGHNAVLCFKKWEG